MITASQRWWSRLPGATRSVCAGERTKIDDANLISPHDAQGRRDRAGAAMARSNGANGELGRFAGAADAQSACLLLRAQRRQHATLDAGRRRRDREVAEYSGAAQ